MTNDSELQVILDELAKAPQAPFSIPWVRQNWYVEHEDIQPDILRHSDNIDGLALENLSRSDTRDDRAILYLHGGGYVCGSIATHRPLTSELARHFNGTIVSVAYRLAPDHPFPAALDDAIAAYESLLKRGVPASGIALAGDSAGGGLAVGMALAIKAAGLPMPGAIWAISPWSDLTNSGDTLKSGMIADPIVSEDSLINCARIYLNGIDPLAPTASPANADLRGLPPMLIHSGTREVLLDDAIKLARAAASAGRKVHLEFWPDMIHVWHLFAPQLSAARQALAAGAKWVEDHLSDPS